LSVIVLTCCSQNRSDRSLALSMFGGSVLCDHRSPFVPISGVHRAIQARKSLDLIVPCDAAQCLRPVDRHRTGNRQQPGSRFSRNVATGYLLLIEVPDFFVVIVAIGRAFSYRSPPDPKLNAATVAAAAGVSVRYANGLLAKECTSIMRLALAMRLQRCRQALEDPLQNHRTVSEIARGWDFSDMTHFGRSFRTMYGATARLPEKLETTLSGQASRVFAFSRLPNAKRIGGAKRSSTLPARCPAMSASDHVWTAPWHGIDGSSSIYVELWPSPATCGNTYPDPVRPLTPLP
jgi:AraC-like DNA-binding protein